MASPDIVQEAAIDQLCAITATETTMGRRSIEQVLRSTDWNVEVRFLPFMRLELELMSLQQAADLIFTNPDALRQADAFRPAHGPERTAPADPPPRRRTNPARGPPIAPRVGLSPLSVITWPLRFVLKLISGLWFLLGKCSFRSFASRLTRFYSSERPSPRPLALYAPIHAPSVPRHLVRILDPIRADDLVP